MSFSSPYFFCSLRHTVSKMTGASLISRSDLTTGAVDR